MSNENSMSNRGSERKTLVLAVVAGICGDALLSWITMSDVSFSIFPVIALVLSVQALYQEYLRNPVAEDIPLVGLACFFVGAFGHSAFIKAQYPDAGSNFFAILVSLLLLLWVGKKLGFVGKPRVE
ncbi:YijD family membrane protein [Vibrio aestuarianus]|uniref:YijD family membrane protein n=1 Tax=Vibrio aestuarianus TaxID=28171 RepID=A0A9X4FAD4_9VIBR|nr:MULTISPECIES: YijD family membrane protein [Vibrio]MDE1225522.1 YijD family membrane protein [Vibrio aestuarianus]MDE1233139.1 YijD family membrane protein [Vibrio aestuarianus]MDE1235498.1 YijD family membrane protein [Vibrio aestuarianus]MDE1246376.1 YijD family membrane protein [Vibrio aestuarianus]MDE1265723.1 YijD family membrane protein [Vibrio aestuarianus]